MSNIVQRNYLEIKSIDGLLEVSKPNLNLNILLIDKPDHQLNKFFYKEIGKKHPYKVYLCAYRVLSPYRLYNWPLEGNRALFRKIHMENLIQKYRS